MWGKILGRRGGPCGIRLLVRQAATGLYSPYSLTSYGPRPQFAKQGTQQNGSDSPGPQDNQNHYRVNPRHEDGSFLTLWLSACKGILRSIIYHRGKITELKLSTQRQRERGGERVRHRRWLPDGEGAAVLLAPECPKE